MKTKLEWKRVEGRTGDTMSTLHNSSVVDETPVFFKDVQAKLFRHMHNSSSVDFTLVFFNEILEEVVCRVKVLIK